MIYTAGEAIAAKICAFKLQVKISWGGMMAAKALHYLPTGIVNM